MKNPFKTQGFDTLISKGMVLRAATMMLPAGSTTIVDGEVHGPDIKEVAEPNPNSFVNKLVGNTQTTLVVNGKVDCVNNIEVFNITIIGNVTVDKIICEGTLAIKSGAKVTANEIRYRSCSRTDVASGSYFSWGTGVMERIIMIIALVFAFSSIVKGCNKTDNACSVAHYVHGSTSCD